ncbi:hypothetical protein ACFQ0G_54000 [Streptomyces chiangmaiensis]
MLDVGLLAGPAERGLVGPGMYAGGVRIGEDDGAGEEVVQAADQVRIRVLRLTAAHGGSGVLQDGGQIPPAGLLLLPELAVRALLHHLHHAVQALVPVHPARLLQRLANLGDGLFDRPAVGVVRQQGSSRVLRIGPLRHDPVADLRVQLRGLAARACLTLLLRLVPAVYVRVALRGVGRPPVLAYQRPDALQLVPSDRCQPVLRTERSRPVLSALQAASGHQSS